jgi:DUF917 family protein
MPKMTLKTITEVEDFVRGLGILGTGGGGEPSKGLTMLEASLICTIFACSLIPPSL